MNLKARLTKLEKAWYRLEAEHYSKSWQELYDYDKDVLNGREELDQMIDAANPPYWFWPAKEEWQRKFGWCMTHNPRAEALYDGMLSRLKTFVDGKTELV